MLTLVACCMAVIIIRNTESVLDKVVVHDSCFFGMVMKVTINSMVRIQTVMKSRGGAC